MARDFETELVVTNLAEDVTVAHRNEVIELVDSAVPGEGQDALFREQVVELEFSQFYVEPGTAPEVVEAGKDAFEVERAGGVRGGQQEEREVLFQRTSGVKIETAQVEAGIGNALDR